MIALVVTPEGLPLAYVIPGNTADKTTLRGMLATILRRYGQAERIWVMDREVPTENILAELRTAKASVRYLVGTPKGRLTRCETALTELPWQDLRPELRVKCCLVKANCRDSPKVVLASTWKAACLVASLRCIGNAWTNNKNKSPSKMRR